MGFAGFGFEIPRDARPPGTPRGRPVGSTGGLGIWSGRGDGSNQRSRLIVLPSARAAWAAASRAIGTRKGEHET